jgi:hypothetical protein
MGHVGHLGGMGTAQLGREGAHLGGIGAAHMRGIGSGRLGTMGGTVRGHGRVAHDYGRHDRRYDRDWGWGGDYAASCSIYEPYYRSWCVGDVDSGIMQY